jgi:hypothetical protein
VVAESADAITVDGVLAQLHRVCVSDGALGAGELTVSQVPTQPSPTRL